VLLYLERWVETLQSILGFLNTESSSTTTRLFSLDDSSLGDALESSWTTFRCCR
jgi:hypothetical protein